MMFYKNYKKTRLIFVVLLAGCMFSIFSQGVSDTQNLVADVESDDIYTQLRVSHFLDQRIRKINADFDDLLKIETDKIEKQFILSLDEIESIPPEIWETDADHKIRIEGLIEDLRGETSRALIEAEEKNRIKREGSVIVFQEMLDQTEESLQELRVIENEYLTLELQEYDRNERKWPILIKSDHLNNNFNGLEAVIDFYEHGNEIETVQRQIVDFLQATESNALFATIYWNIEKDSLHNRFVFVVQKVLIENTINGLVYNTNHPEGILTKAFHVVGDMYGSSTVKRISVISDAYISQKSFSPNTHANLSFELFPKNIISPTLSLHVEDRSLFKVVDCTIMPLSDQGETRLILTDGEGRHIKAFPIEIAHRVGDQGPAGGYVFYDAGDYSRGWRYLEVAPAGWSGERNDPWYIFGYYRSLGGGRAIEVVPTATHVGSGQANTEALVSAMGYEAYQYDFGSMRKPYAARVASDYSVTIDGEVFDDWFLPSKDELRALFESLAKSRLNFGLSGSYWSSSERGATEAWYQDLYGIGSSTTDERYHRWRVRPIRSF